MAKYLKEFSTTAEYESYINNSPTLPNVSLTLDDNVVHYNKKPDYSKEYLTFEALESGTFTLTVPAAVDSTLMTSVSYSTDDGANWVTTMIDNTAQTITTPTINAGDKVLWKGIGSKTGYASNGGSTFSSTGRYNVYGNLNSIFWGDNFENAQPIGEYYGRYLCVALFKNSVKLVSAKNLILPSFKGSYEYSGGNLFSYMFSGCTALTEAPELPATIRPYVYNSMFYCCTSLTTAPELPGTRLAQGCYQNMFEGCSSLTTAPELPATTLANYCYASMFRNCRNINSITMLATNISATNCLNNWVQGVAATGTFTKAASMTTLPTGVNGIPSGWTVVEIN